MASKTCQIHLFTIFVLFFLICSFLPSRSYGSRILSVSFMSIKSHKITYDPLLEALASRGHDVTVLSPIPNNKTVKNLREILTIDSENMLTDMNLFESKERKETFNIFAFFPKMISLCSDSLDLPQVKALQKEKFDLIFISAAMNECAAAWAYTFNTSMIFISPLSVPSAVTSHYGNPSPPSFVPNIITGYTHRMTFYERMINLLVEGFLRYIVDLFYTPYIQSIYREKLNPNLPSVGDIYKSTSLILSNSHFSVSSVRPFLPDIIEVGGMHCRPAQPLPKDLEDFVNSSGEDGFILFSMGTALKGTLMPEEKRLRILSTFAKLKQKILWKWETETMPDLPNNVKLSKWLPQQDLLGHPKIKLFITHGGLGSTSEAAYHGVPLVGIPIFGDQVINMDLARKTGYAATLDFNEITESTLYKVINEVLTQPRYKENAKALSQVFRDQPDHPLDRAVFWSEYVIRHNGARHLRSSARELNFFQYHSIDVIGLIITTILIVLCVVYVIIKKLVRGICSLIFRNSILKPDLKKKKK